MLSQLVYVSNRSASCTEEEIQKILAKCQENNKSLDITGVLLYSNTKFLQYLEGDFKKIRALYDKISLDPRHKNAMLISYGPLKDRYFPSWQMGAKELSKEKYTFDTTLTESEKADFQDLLAGKKAEENRAIQLIKKFFN